MSAPELEQVAEKPAKKKGKGLVLMLIVLVLAGGGGGAYWWLSRTPGGEVEAAPREVPLAERGLVPFEPFMVNLADGGSRYLKVNLQLVLEDAQTAAEVAETPVVISRVRSEILELLTQQTAAALVTPEGKAALKTAIAERLTPVLEGKKVIDVLFSEFVVQF